MANLELATHLHVAVCPAANEIPACPNAEQCSLSCVSLYVDHLEKCTRCVHHLCGNDMEIHTTSACNNVHCQKIVNFWKLKGDIIDCCYKHKLKPHSYNFEQIFRQLEVLFKLDFENITYQPTHNRYSNNNNADADNNEYTSKNTIVLFDFLGLFQTFKANMAACQMRIDGGDLCGILQTISQQLNAAQSLEAIKK